MEEIRKTQAQMHKDYFDKVSDAIDGGFYLEAVFLEYAAIEGRLEVILGILGCPCNKDLTDADRSRINISHRIVCLKKYYIQRNKLTEKSKLDEKYFHELKSWLNERNGYVHGLYKNASEYTNRKSQAQQIAVTGKELSRLLYNEAKRLRRLYKVSNDLFMEHPKCKSKKCSQYREEIENDNL